LLISSASTPLDHAADRFADCLMMTRSLMHLPSSIYRHSVNRPSAVAENHQGGSNFRCSANHFDYALRGALTSSDRSGLIMLTAITAIIIVLSIGILIATL
jgi:hypothetical protein